MVFQGAGLANSMHFISHYLKCLASELLDLQMSVRSDLASMGSCLQGGGHGVQRLLGMSSTA